jgi:acyl-CoA carboxylase epsilon subunit
VIEREATDGPLLRVVRGDPTPEELAALLVVLATRAAAVSDSPPPRSAWNAPARLVRRPVAHAPGGWRSSALPD